MDNLARQGYEVYLPNLKVLKDSAIALEPLFPRYLFFRAGRVGQSIAPVRSTVGVVTFVQFGGIPATVSDVAMDGIRGLEKQQHAADLPELSGVRPGKVVFITAGPLTGLEGLVAMVSRERVTVLMQLLGKETRVTMGLRELRPAA